MSQTIIISQTIMILQTHDRKLRCLAFTLFELMVVLAIIAAMVTIVVPYATRSNEALKITQECLSLAESVRYIADLAMHTKRPTRMLIDPRNKSYLLEIATGISNQDFMPVDAIGDAIHYFGQNIRIIDITGFSVEKNVHCIVFEPTKLWPNASITLSVGDEVKKITIRSRRVEIEDSTI